MVDMLRVLDERVGVCSRAEVLRRGVGGTSE